MGEVTAQLNSSCLDISAALNVDPMSRVVLAPLNDSFRIGRLRFDFVEDSDGDGVSDNYDNCPDIANSDQANADGDGAGDACDPDSDGDGAGDVCDADLDAV